MRWYTRHHHLVIISSAAGTNLIPSLSMLLAPLRRLLLITPTISAYQSPFLRSNSLPSILNMSTTTTTALNSTASSYPPPSAQLRKWNARMHDDHGWLKTFLTFSFAGHHDPKWDSFGPLRVVNEDRIEAGT